MNIKIPEGWEIRKLGEIAEITMGQSPKSEFYNTEKKGLPFLQGNKTFGYRFPSKELYCSKPIKIAERGDVLFSVRAPVGEINIANEKICIGRGLAGLRMKNKSNLFLYYLLLQLKKTIISSSRGTVFSSITKKELENFKVVVPQNFKEQEKIADILGSIDDQIENLMEQNKTLEEIAKTIFKRWFIDFEFPNEEGKPYKSSGGEFIDSELGKIPKGWRVGTFGELIKDTIGGDWGKETVKGKFNKKVYAIRGTDFKNLDIGLYDNLPIRYIKSSSLEKRELKEGELLIELSGGTKGQPTGRIFYVSKSIIENSTYPLVFSNFCRKLIVNKSARPEFIYFYWKYLYSKGVMANYQTESTGISNFQLKSFLKTFKIYIPPKELQNKFSNFAKNIMNKKQNNQIQTLTQLRDTLLPKLITGQIRVKV